MKVHCNFVFMYILIYLKKIQLAPLHHLVARLRDRYLQLHTLLENTSDAT